MVVHVLEMTIASLGLTTNTSFRVASLALGSLDEVGGRGVIAVCGGGAGANEAVGDIPPDVEVVSLAMLVMLHLSRHLGN